MKPSNCASNPSEKCGRKYQLSHLVRFASYMQKNKPDLDNLYKAYCDKSVSGFVAAHALWSVAWAEGGMPTVSITDQLACSLSMSRIPEDMVRPPWPFFAIVLPQSTIELDTGTPIAIILVDWIEETRARSLGGQQALVSITLIGTNAEVKKGPVLNSFSESSSGYVGVDVSHDGAAPLSDHDARLFDALHRLVMGIACHSTVADAPSRRTFSGPPKRRFGPPSTWDFKLCDPVSFDARPALRTYLREGKSPTVQGIVRGHWKRQPCGSNRSGRKMIHVEPYWRGPEDAPIVVRERRMG